MVAVNTGSSVGCRAMYLCTCRFLWRPFTIQQMLHWSYLAVAGEDLLWSFHKSFSSHHKPGEVLDLVESLQEVSCGLTTQL